MNIPGFTAEVSIYRSSGSYLANSTGILVNQSISVVPQQGILSEVDLFMEPIPLDPHLEMCRRKRNDCLDRCATEYQNCNESASSFTDRRECLLSSFGCQDDCESKYQSCTNVMINLDYDPFVDRMNPIPMRSRPLPFGPR